jgi:hypothetical protein
LLARDTVTSAQQNQQQQQQQQQQSYHQHHHNQSPNIYRGVSYDPATMMWRARIYCSGKHVTLGRFETAQEAAFVHDRAAVYIHGDDARTNYDIEAARQSNQRQPPTPSWRVMSTLETLARAARLRKLGALPSSGAACPSARVLSSGSTYSFPGASAAATAATAATDARAQQRHQDTAAAAVVPWTLWALSQQDAFWTHAPSPPPHPATAAAAARDTMIQRENAASAQRAQQQQQQQQKQQQQSVRTLMTIARRLM